MGTAAIHSVNESTLSPTELFPLVYRAFFSALSICKRCVLLCITEEVGSRWETFFFNFICLLKIIGEKL